MTWRSLLYVPAGTPRFLDRAQERGADALILDLEDSVPEAGKDAARQLIADRWDTLAAGPSDLLVRINAGLLDAAADLRAVVRPGLCAIYLPKVDGPDRVRWIGEAVAALEAERGIAAGTVGLVPLIETPHGLEAAFAIAAAPRVVALSLGGEDLAAACGMEPGPATLDGPRQRIVMAARAAGAAPLGLLSTAGAMEAVDEALVARSRAFGFEGASAVHPSAIPALNRGFMPSDDEVSWARSVLVVLEQAATAGQGAARLGARMVDRPMQLRAQAILARAGR